MSCISGRKGTGEVKEKRRRLEQDSTNRVAYSVQLDAQRNDVFLLQLMPSLVQKKLHSASVTWFLGRRVDSPELNATHLRLVSNLNPEKNRSMAIVR
jgi:hypothetical protein